MELLDPEGNGQWSGLKSWPLIPLHMLVLPDGKVLSFGTNEDGMQGASFVFDIYDPETDLHYTLPNNTATDIFCSHMALDPSTGNVLIFGGDARKSGDGGALDGVNTLHIFNPKTLELSQASEAMDFPRWYPSVVTLANGDILTVGGRNLEKNGSSIPEVWNSSTGFRQLTGAEIEDMKGSPTDNGSLDEAWWYPHVFQRANGDVVVIEAYGSDVYIMNTEGTGSLQEVGTIPFSSHKMDPSLMYDVDKVMMTDIDGGLWSVDLSTFVPTYTKVAQMPDGRVAGSMNVLPDGSVVITGGTDYDQDVAGQGSDGSDLDNAQKEALRFIPETNELLVLEGETLARLYHSAALQLEDGRILSAGGGAPGPLNNLNGEFFSPDIYYNDDGSLADAPNITGITKIVGAGSTFTINVDDAFSISKVGAVKSGAATHSTNSDTRYVSLDFQVADTNTIVATAPGANVMIPGHWMVSVVDNAGVPSAFESIGVNVTTDLFEGYGPITATTNEPRPDQPDIDGAFTVEATARFDDLDGGVWQRIFDFGNGPASDNVWMGQVAGTNSMRFEIFVGSNVTFIEAPNSIIEGETAVWTASVNEAGFMTLSKNGVQLASGQGQVPADVFRGNEFVGSSNWGADTPLIGEVSSLAFTGNVTYPETPTAPPPVIDPTPEPTPPSDDENRVQHVEGITQHLVGSSDKVDVFVVSGNISEYGYGPTEDGQGIVIWGDTGFDIMFDFDKIEFADVILDIATNTTTPNTGTPPSPTPTPQPDVVNEIIDEAGVTEWVLGTSDEDAFVINANSNEFGISKTLDGQDYVVYNGDTFDILYDIEQIEFNDTIIILDDLA